ncbi:MAG: DegT/DnrJ/EryC1/StrS family aminotransferase [Candidatus Scalindua sp.]|jgi:dTDP-4-amino-4,6-dideoxygalactose transaminase|nr:DegT/DnrJ/EryC1/StrS family aminotransferase [Candidatus Scalindua sp.]MBT5304252.1 DegT/DnrJ/EryC1/StrS family aminotransferase [Candidatus Scalindua sp.]MBT6049055.1 DegT/DnrJ/EryC1/StrS family aminotransferase [Candidatus Scalindua sp.]MBT6230256.1 DegT/DnrJ/EryC1/StrS family aminotransferase [Candidatus Scalindua sp.]MBT6564718.1 DegT/DnrJ/EryC1/StrS family aminotransferase [Candidatus Scalindua sp.]
MSSTVNEKTITKVPLIDLKRQYRSMKEELNSAIQDVLESQAFILGPQVKEFEDLFASYCNTNHAIGVSSGTDALLLALKSLGIGDGDEVITTPFTFFATVEAICNVGAKPVFADIDPETYNIRPDLIEKSISKRTKAIIPVHLYGQCADMDQILEIAKKNNLRVIEDSAQAVGAEYRGKKAGSMGDLGCFSFFPSKNLGGMGDGGMVTCNSEELEELIHMLRIHGGRPKNYHASLGINGRLDTIQASILIKKLGHLDDWCDKRRQKASYYTEKLKELDLVTPKVMSFNKHAFHLYVIRVKERDGLMEHLKANNIGCAVYYPVPQHLQECLADLGHKEGDMPETEMAAKETLALPVFPEITEEEQDYVIESVKDFFSS